MSAPAASDDLLFGLVALQNGLVNQGQLVAAFQAWTLDKSRPLAAHIVARRDLSTDGKAAVDVMVAMHIKKHGDAQEPCSRPRGQIHSSETGRTRRPGDRGNA